ncbi:MAG: Fic family protein [Lachnoclostridium sp.]|nr:Fic family protein [Lachnospira sp.]MCM1247398.1 Fic family protein [Lachnoclostridium sp.]MCM1536175.1 Fic family protein [Clostridium sp.]
MADNMGGNRAGKYEVVRNRSGMADAGGRLYYQTYIPADLKWVDESPFASDELKNRLNAIYREIGRQQGLGFYEDDFKRKNVQLYKQELVAVLQNKKSFVELSDIFGFRTTNEISGKLEFYGAMGDKDSFTCMDILMGMVEIQKKPYRFRKHQIWEESSVRRISLREHNPPAPERIMDLMMDLDDYRRRETEADMMVRAALLCYQFLTIMPYEEDNEIWASILLNRFLREQGCELGYYIPFAKYFLGQDENRKNLMKQVREEEDYHSWIVFFLQVVEDSLTQTNRTIMQLERIHKDTLSVISGEKQKALLAKILAYMEEYPIFIIGDIEKTFDVAYNTAAKAVLMLEKKGLVKEISHKQRYRIYSYDRYMKELIKRI